MNQIQVQVSRAIEQIKTDVEKKYGVKLRLISSDMTVTPGTVIYLYTYSNGHILLRLTIVVDLRNNNNDLRNNNNNVDIYYRIYRRGRAETMKPNNRDTIG